MNQLLLYPMLIFNLINVRQKIDHIIRHEVVTKSLKHRPTLGDHKDQIACVHDFIFFVPV
ncbi:hypothetical protein ACJIZ3_006294 [Penstemon smallii]|uniref:Uncharacterized protein n=1 Tax=Penstemon smallii TaxID=265156 RepID=A0ABD3S7C1_9LAMI